MDSAILNILTHLQLCLHPTGCLPEDGQRVECYEHWCTKIALTTLSPHRSHECSPPFSLCIFLFSVSRMKFVKSNEENDCFQTCFLNTPLIWYCSAKKWPLQKLTQWLSRCCQACQEVEKNHLFRGKSTFAKFIWVASAYELWY